ncbi:Rieske iron-sulfur protein [Acidocella aquatica]|uniref:Rieske iron-sulfur protein n=1 Tax=Acidocella aquatica TaxID=1922313 RepID=A0ABQ6ADV1_9PROT|nr:Rieske iron-sulfur protein [Acidocella aquatica]
MSSDIGNQELVIWRDAAGIARAMEDRCPHRRAPLSRGCVRENGLIQCGYHGWSFDGETGRLREIPNMKSEQRFPPLYKAQSFAVAESGGFVRVCLTPGAEAPAVDAASLPLYGTAHVGLAQEHYLSTFFDDPGMLFGIKGVEFTPYLASDLKAEAGRLVMERNCQWRGLHWPSSFSSEFPISLLSKTDPLTGETELTLRDDALRTLLTAVIAPVPAARGSTAIRWRARLAKTLNGLRAKQLLIGAPFRVFDTIDAAALRRLTPSASVQWQDLRAAIIQTSQASAA